MWPQPSRHTDSLSPSPPSRSAALPPHSMRTSLSIRGGYLATHHNHYSALFHLPHCRPPPAKTWLPRRSSRVNPVLPTEYCYRLCSACATSTAGTRGHMHPHWSGQVPQASGPGPSSTMVISGPKRPGHTTQRLNVSLPPSLPALKAQNLGRYEERDTSSATSGRCPILSLWHSIHPCL